MFSSSRVLDHLRRRVKATAATSIVTPSLLQGKHHPATMTTNLQIGTLEVVGAQEVYLLADLTTVMDSEAGLMVTQESVALQQAMVETMATTLEMHSTIYSAPLPRSLRRLISHGRLPMRPTCTSIEISIAYPSQPCQPMPPEREGGLLSSQPTLRR
jgi:hypothetical protein